MPTCLDCLEDVPAEGRCCIDCAAERVRKWMESRPEKKPAAKKDRRGA